MKLKMRASMISMLLLFFTLVLFYQNCSQEGSSDLFSGGPGDEERGPRGSNTLTLKFFVDGVEIDPRFALDYRHTVSAQLISGKTAPLGSNSKSILGCLYLPDIQTSNHCNMVLNYTLPLGGAPGCEASGWREMDCGDPSWVKETLPNGDVKYTNRDLFSFLKVNGAIPCDQVVRRFSLYFKPNDGLANIQAPVNLSITRCN